MASKINICFNPHGGVVESMSCEELLKTVHELGCKGFEPMASPRWLGDFSDSAVEKVKRCAESLDMDIPVLTCAQFSPTQAANISASDAYFRKCALLAPKLGAGTILLWPNHNSGLFKEDEFDRFRQVINIILNENPDVSIAIEFEKGHLLDNYREGLYWLSDFDPKACLPRRSRRRQVGLVADTFHVFNDEADPKRAAIAMGKKLSHVHLSDSERKAPGSGKFDYSAFFSGLKTINYQGAYSLQFNVSRLEQIQEAVLFAQRVAEEV